MEEFRNYSKKIQKFHYETLRDTIYDEIKPQQFNVFEKILTNYMSAEKASALAKKLYLREILRYRILIVNAFFEEKCFSVPVVKVYENETQFVFYDDVPRKYESWKDYLSNNTLPKCTMMFPIDGEYKLDNKKEVQLDERNSPANGLGRKIDSVLYVLATVGDVVCTGASLFAPMKPYASQVTIASGICNSYRVGRNACALIDRYSHDQSMSDDETMKHWMHIGHGFLSFAVTAGQCYFGNPSNDMTFMNILTLFQKCVVKDDPIKSLGTLKSQFLNMHLIVLTDKAATLFQNFLKSEVNIDVNFEFIYQLVNSAAQESKKHQVRYLATVDDRIMRDALTTLCYSKNIEREAITSQKSLHEFVSEYRKLSEAIIKEIVVWGAKEISDSRLQFRISYICQGKVPYETISEMCDHFKVGRKEDVQVNGRKIFEGVCEQLEDVIRTTVKEYPQLLVYYVEYVQENNDVELEGFRDYFRKRVIKDAEEGFRKISLHSDNIAWIDALNFQEINYCQNKSNEIHFARPKQNDFQLDTGDVFKLAKKMMGRVGKVDFKFVRPDLDWVVAACVSSRCCVVVGPKITSNFGSVTGTFPVFKSTF